MVKRIKDDGRARRPNSHSQADRAYVFTMIDALMNDRVVEDEEEAAFDEFWGTWVEREGELSSEHRTISNGVYDIWFAFDRRLDSGARVVDELLAAGGHPLGIRRFMEALRDSSMRLYEIVDTIPGVSVTLRDLLEDDTVVVSERSGSRTLDRWEWIAARVIPRGVSGKPEMEAGVLHVPRLVRDAVRTQLTAMRDAFRRANPDKDIREFYKEEFPPFVHDAWVTSLLKPPLPAMRNTDGEDMVITQVTFDVLDEARVSAALASRGDLEPVAEGRWTWSGNNREGKPVILGTLTLSSARLVAETNSVARGERARALVDSLATDALRHRSTTHEDPTQRIRDSLRERARGVVDGRRRPEESALPKEVAETLVLDHMERHYRAWLDEPVPALDGRTPRVVAREGDRVSRERLIQLLHDLEGMYLRALRDDEPAYDASWMWRELGLADDETPKYPPPLAHERIAELLGVGAMSRTLAERARQAADFEDASTLLTVAALKGDLDVQRFLHAPATRAASAPAVDEAWLVDWLLLLANFDLHRRKTFWVDESLAFALDHSDVDVLGRELRAPFPSSAFVFTDRHVLSLAERALARVERAKEGTAQPLVGQLLRVVTAYLTDEAPREPAQARTLAICFAVDALGADPPATMRYRLALDDEVRVAAGIDEIDPPPSVDLVDGAPVLDTSPVRALLRIALNAVLYATNAGRDAEVRAPPARGGPEKAAPAPVGYSSDGVFLLPGAIEISNVRHLQELERSPGGREYVHRFLVRGHWRRPAQAWSDQRLRWIAPYWKGPSLAATVERLYKMKP